MKIKPMIFVSYCEDMKAYVLFDPISKFLFQRDVHFDEGFNPTSYPSPPLDCDANYGADHADSFTLIEAEDNEHLEDETQT
jgi:hypothetical protein